MIGWLGWFHRNVLLVGVVLVAVGGLVLTKDLLSRGAPKPPQQEDPIPTRAAAVPEWEEPVAVPLEDVERGGWKLDWVVVKGIVAPDGADGRDWIGIAADGQKTRVVLLFHTRDFRRCQAGQVIKVEGYLRGSVGGVMEMVECRLQE
jgi:hypothetical protein